MRGGGALGLLLGLLVGGVWGSQAHASAVLSVDLEGLTSASDVVVHGRVVRTQSRWSADGRRIFTDVELEVEETLKGDERRRLVIRHPGGVVDGLGQKVSGMAAFARGEEVVVFLERQPGRTYRVSALAQGKFQVKREGGAPPLAVPAPMAGAVLIDPSTRQPTRSRLRSLPLSELRREVARFSAPAPKGEP